MSQIDNKKHTVKLFVKSGVDKQRLGACPFCQRVHMVLHIKKKHQLLDYKIVVTNPSKLPPELKNLGLKHLPAIVHADEGFDAVDDIISYLDQKFPGGDLDYKNQEAETATKDFFSKFCFYVKAVIQDPSGLTSSLRVLDEYLERQFAAHPILREATNLTSSSYQNLCSEAICHLDCEVLPKLQHLRVAAKHLKNYDIPIDFKGIWRYLHTAYNNEIFTETCPCDQEILLHWHDRPETPKLSPKKHSLISKEKPKFSFDIPVQASLVQIS